MKSYMATYHSGGPFFIADVVIMELDNWNDHNVKKLTKVSPRCEFVLAMKGPLSLLSLALVICNNHTTEFVEFVLTSPLAGSSALSEKAARIRLVSSRLCATHSKKKKEHTRHVVMFYPIV